MPAELAQEAWNIALQISRHDRGPLVLNTSDAWSNSGSYELRHRTGFGVIGNTVKPYHYIVTTSDPNTDHEYSDPLLREEHVSFNLDSLICLFVYGPPSLVDKYVHDQSAWRSFRGTLMALEWPRFPNLESIAGRDGELTLHKWAVYFRKAFRLYVSQSKHHLLEGPLTRVQAIVYTWSSILKQKYPVTEFVHDVVLGFQRNTDGRNTQQYFKDMRPESVTHPRGFVLDALMDINGVTDMGIVANLVPLCTAAAVIIMNFTREKDTDAERNVNVIQTAFSTLWQSRVHAPFRVSIDGKFVAFDDAEKPVSVQEVLWMGLMHSWEAFVRYVDPKTRDLFLKHSSTCTPVVQFLTDPGFRRNWTALVAPFSNEFDSFDRMTPRMLKRLLNHPSVLSEEEVADRIAGGRHVFLMGLDVTVSASSREDVLEAVCDGIARYLERRDADLMLKLPYRDTETAAFLPLLVRLPVWKPSHFVAAAAAVSRNFKRVPSDPAVKFAELARRYIQEGTRPQGWPTRDDWEKSVHALVSATGLRVDGISLRGLDDVSVSLWDGNSHFHLPFGSFLFALFGQQVVGRANVTQLERA